MLKDRGENQRSPRVPRFRRLRKDNQQKRADILERKRWESLMINQLSLTLKRFEEDEKNFEEPTLVLRQLTEYLRRPSQIPPFLLNLIFQELSDLAARVKQTSLGSEWLTLNSLFQAAHERQIRVLRLQGETEETQRRRRRRAVATGYSFAPFEHKPSPKVIPEIQYHWREPPLRRRKRSKISSKRFKKKKRRLAIRSRGRFVGRDNHMEENCLIRDIS